MTRVSAVASASLAASPPLKPPVIAQTAGPANTIMATVKTASTGSSTESACSANARAASRPPAGPPSLRLTIGTNADANAPSANSARKKFGSLDAIRKASLAKPAPRKCAPSMSRTKPSTRETSVRPPMVAVARTRFMRELSSPARGEGPPQAVEGQRAQASGLFPAPPPCLRHGPPPRAGEDIYYAFPIGWPAASCSRCAM